MKTTFRWFGKEDDSITLEQIRQIPGCSGLMGTMPQYAAGALWPKEEIRAYVQDVHAAGLAVEVIESVNVHEDIKLGRPSRDGYIETYRQTIRNLAEEGVKVIVYNFMPVLDWLRTDLNHPLPDGSFAMYYNHNAVDGVDPKSLVTGTLNGSGGFSLPGWEPDRLSELEQTLQAYRGVSEDDLRQNLAYFLRAVCPVCEECGVKLAIHPDDPAWPIFGLPRIAHSERDMEQILALYDSPANSLCLCTGSLGSEPSNDVAAMIRRFGKAGRIACVHIRNIRFLGEKEFCESSHLSSDGTLQKEVIASIAKTCMLSPQEAEAFAFVTANPAKVRKAVVMMN